MRRRLRRLSLLAITASVFGVLACGGDADGVTTIVITSEPVAKVAPAPVISAAPDLPTLPVLSDYPLHLVGTQQWINSEPLTFEELGNEGQIILVDFWTYTCSNCIATYPSLKSLHEKYSDQGLTIVGVHTPEFQFEHVYENVVEAVARYELEYPIVQDNDYNTWRAFSNKYWPAQYLLDTQGRLRYRHFGEGRYQETEQAVRALLVEAGNDVSGIEPAYQ